MDDGMWAHKVSELFRFGDAKGERVYHCAHCSWIRRVTTPKANSPFREVTHPIYGRVTVEKMAVMDVFKHDCEEHLDAVKRQRYRNAFYRSNA